MKLAIFLAQCSLFSFGLIGCVQGRKFNAATPWHAAGIVVSSQNLSQWHSTTWEQYVELVAPGNIALECIEKECFLPDQHPLAARLNLWAEELHKKLSNRLPNLKNVPAPKVILAKATMPYAFADTVATCVKVPSLFKGSKGTKEFAAGAITIVKGSVRDTSACIEQSDTQNLIQQAASFVNETASPCQMHYSNDNLTIAETCPRNKYFDAFYGAPKSAVTQVSNRLLLSTGLLRATKSEEGALAVLFHEMAHYYRAHPIIPENRFTVFYRDSSLAKNARPQEDSSMRALAEEVKQVLGDKQNPSRTKRLEELTKRMENERLGYYSFEQEADELSLEFLADVGIGPSAAMQAHLDILKVLPPKAVGVPYETCKSWLAANWQDETGKAIVVPLGGLAQPHHDVCYRIFNLSREAVTHGYTLAERPTMPAFDWQKSLNDLVL